MIDEERLQKVRDAYRAYETGDRSLIEPNLSEDFTFFAPPDPGIDRATYFERCWPNAGLIQSYALKRLMPVGDDEVLVTYEAAKTDGKRFRNSEILTFDGEMISRVEVYFGWNL